MGNNTQVNKQRVQGNETETKIQMYICTKDLLNVSLIPTVEVTIVILGLTVFYPVRGIVEM